MPQILHTLGEYFPHSATVARMVAEHEHRPAQPTISVWVSTARTRWELVPYSRARTHVPVRVSLTSRGATVVYGEHRLELLRTGKGVLELTSTSRPGSPATVSAALHFQKGLNLRQLVWSRVPRFARVHRANERVALTSQGEKDRRGGESGKSASR